MIDPITALAGIQSAVALIKKASKTVDDVASLGPVLGKYFDAKKTATKAITEVKSSGKKSNMAVAIEIEMAIHQAEQFEKELQMLFILSNKIDVWNKIKARSLAMDVEEAHRARKEKELAIKKQKKIQENIEILFALLILIIAITFCVWGLMEIMDYCQKGNCSR
jgi:hypothetical protein